MRWLCILLPQLALDGVLRGCFDPQAPRVLVDGPQQRRVLRAVSPSARRLGLRAGQTLSAARALNGSFSAVDYDARAIEDWRRLLAAWAYGYSSQVSLHFPRVLLLEIGSSLALFGPWPRLEARLREELTALGFQHRLVLAPNPLAARVLANVHDGLAVATPRLRETLARLPLQRAGLPGATAEALQRMGLRSLGELLGMPRDSLARRFAPELLRHLDTLLGERPLALECYRPPDRFDQRLELNFDVESHPALLFPLRRLTADLGAFLAGRDRGVQRFVLHLEHADGPDSQVPVGLLSAERVPARLFELARGRLERLQVPAPVRALRLVAEELPAFVPERRELFEERAQQHLAWEALRERLRARLGDDAVQALGLRADHRPECAWSPQCSAAPVAAEARLRPGWLLQAPQPLDELAPQILAGPERIESGWWDGADVRRDYYRVQTRNGQWAWVYRPAGGTGPFVLHGWFA
ncbi:MAG: DNA polymerase Y family protein [Pseudomonas sp.]|uniref:Y-family DNA polymerase n=1 Tax=Pseudomonas sp. TaxID=306 RepID=UPI003393C729